MSGQAEIVDYLVIGHVSLDRMPNGARAGGTVTYSARAAHALGCRTAAVTSCGSDFSLERHLPGIETEAVPAAVTTTFTNVDTGTGRRQILHQQAAPLTPMPLPETWARAPIVHLGPVAGEVDPAWIDHFPHNLIGITPQGWLRCWDEQGHVSACRWGQAATVLPRVDVVILSTEDLPDAAMLTQFRQWSRLLVLTKAAAGCTVFYNNEIYEVPGVRVTAVESSGAGDIFAAAFYISWRQQPENPVAAAVFANQIAGASVTATTPAAKFTKIKELLSSQRRGSLNL